MTRRYAFTCPQNLEIQSMALKQPFDGDLSLVGAAEMMVILNGIPISLPFLVKRSPQGIGHE